MSIDQDDVKRFLALFRANERSFGNYMPKARGNKMVTIKAAYTQEHARSHLEGEVGLGLVAILDDDTCTWAAIDIDVHGPNSQDVDLLVIERKVSDMKLPLVVCRSKSGGAHLYLFLSEPVPAERVRLQLGRWAAQLGFASAEVFPKQVTLKPMGDEERPLGNWINLPYYDADATERYAVDGGKQVSFEYFLELCETKRTSLGEIALVDDGEFASGPPCLADMLKNKVEENRNIAAFQAAIFLKRAYPEDWNIRVKEFNQNAFIKPLGKGELNTIIASVRRKDYHYKCREEPCKTFCNREVCRTREHGVSGGDETANEIPLIEKVEKVVATPIRWALTVRGEVVEVTTPELYNYEAVRQKVGEKLHLVLPRIKAYEWDQYLREIMGKVTVRYEATLEDIIFAKLCEYLKRASPDKQRSEEDRRDDLKRGRPSLICLAQVTYEKGKVKTERDVAQWHYAFKLPDFIDYLRRRKQLPCPDHQMWSILYKVLGAEAKKDKMRNGEARISNVWVVPEAWVNDEAVPEKKYQTEY